MGLANYRVRDRERERLQLELAAPPSAVPTPAAVPGAVATMPALYPAGPTPHGFLYAQLQSVAAEADAALPLAGGTLTGTLALNTAPSAVLNLDGRWALLTDNLGSPPHTFSGPNLYLNDLSVNKTRVVFKSLGEVAITISDPSLPVNSTSHALQLWGISAAGTAQSGFGTGVQLFLSDTTGTGVQAGNWDCWLTNPTPGFISTAMGWYVFQNSAAVLTLYLDSDGEVRANAPTGFITVPHAPTGATNLANFMSGAAGFVGSASGTHVGLNRAIGGSSNFLDCQIAGVSRLQINSQAELLITQPAGSNQPFWDCQIGGVSVARVNGGGQGAFTFMDTAVNGNAFALRVGHQLSTGTAAAGFGCGVQFFGLDSAGAQVAIGSTRYLQSNATPAGITADWVLQASLAGALQDVAQTTDAGDFKSNHKLLAVSGLGVGNSAVKTTLASPGTVTRSIEVFDASGNSLGSIPVYANGSFS